MDKIKFNKAVDAKTLTYFTRKNNIGITNHTLLDLKNIANHNDNGENARICLHPSPDDTFHDMIILEYKGKRYYRPHKHPQKPETIHIIDGKAIIVIFSPDGKIKHSAILAEDDTRIFRIAADNFHTVIPISNYVLYHESKPGPFKVTSDSVYPVWAPNGQNQKLADNYITKLCGEVS